eukprot:CAMPEP_0174320068 /NCGR_PEP_ID=MMETSP0810-20121108/9298_1 /TAXON_ID=73025 ORGANISM="Eutreptiella gymnastica-like, Strain CCMP1594" /NCGR_SAMPLE_ID=MMETSP0810 /ASSEMBLY_ACC=CAM_ASM_000659 /LENGTH=64 /DNA_ID=CAMNT_0015430847 /DNA_START=87 /DNA_END=278 /DNA_ORIENTATION=+
MGTAGPEGQQQKRTYKTGHSGNRCGHTTFIQKKGQERGREDIGLKMRNDQNPLLQNPLATGQEW